MTVIDTFKRVWPYAFVLAAVLGLLTGCADKNDDAIATVKVEKEKFEIIIPAFGELESIKSTPISLPTHVRGRQTVAWMVPESSMVKAGETVIRLDSSTYFERIKEEEYNIEKINLQIADKEQELLKEKNELKGELNLTSIEKEIADLYAARDESLYSKNKIIEDAVNLEYLKVKTDHYKNKRNKLDEKSQAEQQLLQLKRKTFQVKLDQYKETLDLLELKAPHDGLFVLKKNWRGEKPRVGDTVWSGMTLAQLPDLTQMQAKLYILESEASGLKKDLPVVIVLDSKPELQFTGKVTGFDTIAKSIEKESPLKFFQVKVQLDKTDPQIMKPGNQLKATIFVQKLENVLSVPNQALFFQQDKEGEKIFVHVKKGSSHEKREVKIGVRSLTRTVITEGLREGEGILLGKPDDNQ